MTAAQHGMEMDHIRELVRQMDVQLNTERVCVLTKWQL